MFLDTWCSSWGSPMQLQELDFNDPCVSLSAQDILYSIVHAGEEDWWSHFAEVLPDLWRGSDVQSCWRRLSGMNHCNAVFKINLSDPESLVSEVYRQCASSKFLQAACSAFGSQSGFLDQHTCTVSPSAEVRVIYWLKTDQMFECIWKPVLLLRHAKATSSCLCRQTPLVSIVPVSTVAPVRCCG